MVINLRYTSIISYLIYLKFFEKKILSTLAKKKVCKTAYKFGLKVYLVQESKKLLIQVNFFI